MTAPATYRDRQTAEKATRKARRLARVAKLAAPIDAMTCEWLGCGESRDTSLVHVGSSVNPTFTTDIVLCPTHRHAFE